MRTPRIIRLVVCLAVGVLALLAVGRAAADMAPFPQAAASDVKPGEGTQVQMVAERVVLDMGTLSARVPVTAEFTMRNLGGTVENMEVRFPLSFPSPTEPSAAEYGHEIKDLRAFVEDSEVLTRTAQFDKTPWATWTVRFPPNADVHVRVTYSTKPVDWNTYGDVYYILETGAGWRGPIGRGDIVIRFPYAADAEMIVSHEEGHTPYYPSTTPKFLFEGHELRWHFENLEPTAQDNVSLSVLYPNIWQAILDARQRLQQKPDDAESLIALGQAYFAAIPIKHGWPEYSDLATHFGPLAEEALRRGAELAPNSLDAHVALARFLTDHAWNVPAEPWYSDARREVSRIRELDPNNETAQELANALDNVQLMLPALQASPTAAQMTATATVSPTLAATAMPSPSATAAATATPQPTDTPELASAPTQPAVTAVAPASPSPVPAAPSLVTAVPAAPAAGGQPGGQFPSCIGGAAVILVGTVLTAGSRRLPRGRV